MSCSWLSSVVDTALEIQKRLGGWGVCLAAASNNEMTFRTEQTYPAPDPNQNES